MNQIMSFEFVTTCDRRSSDSLTALIYWESSLNSTSVLLTSCQVSSSWTINYSLRMIKVASRTRILYHQSKSSIKQLWLHVYINLFNVYMTQVKSRIEFSIQSYFIFSSCTSLFHHIFLCSMNDNHWAREHSFWYYNHKHHECKEIVFMIEDQKSKHHCIEYH